MSDANPRGFTPARRLDGQPPARAKLYPTGGRNRAQIYRGDVVYLDTNGELQRVDFSPASATQRGLLGVVQAVYNENKRPFTHNLPATGHYIAASTTGFAAVVDDPDCVFIVELESPCTNAAVGQWCNVTANAPNTAAGYSRLRVADVTATSIGHPFKILGLAYTELAVTAAGSNNNDVEVIITNHMWRKARTNNTMS